MSKGVSGGPQTALYRFYGNGDQLLYIGITDRLGERWGSHMRHKAWWPSVRRQTVDWFPSRDEAAAAEVAAIIAEKPLYNVAHSTRSRDGDDVTAALLVLETAERALAQAKVLLRASTHRSRRGADHPNVDRSSGLLDVDKLLADLNAVAGTERMRLSEIPELLRRADPMYLPYRNLKGTHVGQLLRQLGIRITKTNNIHRLDPADLIRKAG